MRVSFGMGDLPQTEITIEGKSYTVLANLSSIVPLTLNKNVLASIKKKPAKPIQFINVNGDIVHRPAYVVPRIKVGLFTFKNITVAERDEDLDNVQCVGEIGMPMLNQVNLLFDFPHSTIIASNSKDRLKKIGYILDDMTPVHFEMIERAGGIVLPVSVDKAAIKLALSTGSSLSIIRSSYAMIDKLKNSDLGAKFTSASFEIGGKNWGAHEFYVKDFSEELSEFNGTIGMDFLSEHVFYIDFGSKIVYIGEKN